MIGALLALMAQAATPSIPEGERLFRRCVACHALEPGRNTPAGPTLHGVVGRRVAAEPGFRYSAALRAHARAHPRWTQAALDRFLTDPLAAIPGTDMSFQGIADRRERRVLIRWLTRRRGRAN